jgi:hypothetical protein
MKPGFEEGKAMSEQTPSRELPGDPHHTRQAAHLRELAANATTGPLKARLLEEAERLERLAKLA